MSYKALGPKACCAPAPDNSGRTCDKPKRHTGDHWTYGGETLTWPSDRAALKCVGCQRPLEYSQSDWGFLDPTHEPECDECYHKRFAAAFPHAHRIKHRVDQSE